MRWPGHDFPFEEAEVIEVPVELVTYPSDQRVRVRFLGEAGESAREITEHLALREWARV